MRIALIARRHDDRRPSPITHDIVSILRGWGCEVDVLLPDEQPVALEGVAPRHDLTVLKSGTAAALSLAGALHAQGARLLNNYPTAVACRDKVVATRTLQLAGLPVPQTWVTTRPADLATLLREGPLVVKPADGSQGRGVRVVREADALPDEVVDAAPYLVQRFHEPDGMDRKLYCIGGDVFCVLRRWPVRGYEDKLGTPRSVSPRLRELVEAAGSAFGMDLFGMDVVESGGTPVVVDISGFPGFKGVPDAGLRLADYLYFAAAGRDGTGPASTVTAGDLW